MPAVKPKEMADAIIGFEERYNEKLAGLFTPIRGKGLTITRSQAKALFFLQSRPAQTATELGEAMCMTKASLTGILDVLEREGLARREADSGDRRCSRVSLTAAGLRICERKARELDAKLSSRFASLPDSEIRAFVRYLEAATAILGRLED
jgi:DNA-binding MarR family transcriptional regulator